MMKQISTRLLTVLGLCMFFFSACNNSSDFIVKGVVAGADGQLMYLENVGISNVVTLDSIKLAPGGKFKFTEKRPEYPDFYRLRLNNQLINFAVDSKLKGDKGDHLGSTGCKPGYQPLEEGI